MSKQENKSYAYLGWMTLARAGFDLAKLSGWFSGEESRLCSTAASFEVACKWRLVVVGGVEGAWHGEDA